MSEKWKCTSCGKILHVAGKTKDVFCWVCDGKAEPLVEEVNFDHCPECSAFKMVDQELCVACLKETGAKPKPMVNLDEIRKLIEVISLEQIQGAVFRDWEINKPSESGSGTHEVVLYFDKEGSGEKEINIFIKDDGTLVVEGD